MIDHKCFASFVLEELHLISNHIRPYTKKSCQSFFSFSPGSILAAYKRNVLFAVVSHLHLFCERGALFAQSEEIVPVEIAVISNKSLWSRLRFSSVIVGNVVDIISN